MESIFIAGGNGGWIIDKIGNDIKKSAEQLGIPCRIGTYEEYQGEDICYHLFTMLAVPFKEAKHNSLFITHTDDKLKENELYRNKDLFDSFICMSSEDAHFLIELGFDKNKVFGKSLAVRNDYVKPISIGIFSACYPDGRKNEKWLIDYCKSNTNAKLANFVFIGSGWGGVVKELESLKCSTTWLNISRDLPYEYKFQQNYLAHLDYYLYMGMDGGAMGTYDAYAQGVKLCVTFDGFHKTLPYVDNSFDNYITFSKQLKSILDDQQNKINFFLENTPLNYAKWIIDVWTNRYNQEYSEKDTKCISFNSVLEKRRMNYFKITFHRIRRILIGKYLRNKK